MRTLVIGGTGLIGARVSRGLRRRGHEVVVASPSLGVDAMTGNGLDEAMRGAEVVVDVSNPPASGGILPDEFFRRSGQNISAAENRAGARHHVVLSVVGADRMPGSEYFRAKVLQEDLTRRSGVPFTIVRATQFFEFFPAIAQAHTEDGVVRLPSARVQPVAADDVAEALIATAFATAANGLVELAGPESFRLSDIVARVLAADDEPRPVMSERGRRYFGAQIEERTLMPGASAHIAPTSLDVWLARTRQPG